MSLYSNDPSSVDARGNSFILRAVMLDANHSGNVCSAGRSVKVKASTVDLDSPYEKRFVALFHKCLNSIKHSFAAETSTPPHTFNDLRVIQAEIVSCFFCKMKAQRDSLYSHGEMEDDSCEHTSQARAGPLFNLTACTDSQAWSLLMLDASQKIMNQGNNGRIIASSHVDFRCDHSRQYEVVVFLAEGIQLKLHGTQIGVDLKPTRTIVDNLWLDLTGGTRNSVIFSTLDEGRKFCFTICSLHHSAITLELDLFTNPVSLRGMLLDWLGCLPFRIKFPLCRELGASSLSLSDAPFMCAEVPSLRLGNDRQRKGAWASLHELLLWMIKDKLDVFDNWRFASVCRDWWFASQQYPKNLYSVGDGLPWLLNTRKELPSSSREFISVPRKSSFVVDIPEFSGCAVLFSKQGWILLRRKDGCVRKLSSEPLCIVNPFTRAKIELPVVDGMRRVQGSFTTRDGYPDRVVLIVTEHDHEVTIKTACPGDSVWTDHHFSGLERSFVSGFHDITIGNNVYCRDMSSYITVFNVAENSVKVLPPVARLGFIAEHDGQLVYVEDGGVRADNEDRFSTSVVYKYDDSTTTWKRLNKSEVMGTSWYTCSLHGCITVREKGLKVFVLRNIIEGPRPRSFRDISRVGLVDVYDLVTGSRMTLPDLLPGQRGLRWIAIG